EQGDVAKVEHSDRSQEEAMEFGALAGALLGLGAGSEEGAEAGAAAADGSVLDDEEVWYLADAIPLGASAAMALIEQRWAIPRRDAILEAGGQTLADTWVHPQDLVAIGAAAG